MKYYLILFSLFFLVLGNIVSAQSSFSDSVPFQNETERVQEFVDEEKWNYIGEQWQEVLLKNRFISAFDKAFHNVNFLFVVLLARDYSLSLTLFFAFLLWLFTFLWVARAVGAFVTNDLFIYGVGLIIVTIIAHIQIFNKLSDAMFKVMFYKTSPLWSFVIFIVLVVLLILYLYLGRRLALYLKMTRKSMKEAEREHAYAVDKIRRSAEKRATS